MARYTKNSTNLTLIHPSLGLGICRIFLCLILLSGCEQDKNADLLNQIRSEQFVTADNTILVYEENVFSSDTSEEELTTLYDQLATALKEDDLVHLDHWISEDDVNHIPYLLKGMYFYKLGWRHRGDRYLRYTPDENIVKMKEAFATAEGLLLKSININPHAISAYKSLIGLYFANFQRKTKGDAIYKKGIQENPGSTEIRRTFLWFMLPKWGVSYQVRQEYVDEIERASFSNPHLKTVLAYNYAHLADQVNDDYKRASELYNKAMSYGYQCSIHVDETLMMFNYGHYKDALPELNGLVERCPSNASGFLIRARTLRKLGDKKAALANLDKAITLSPGDPQILGTRGFFHIREKNYQKAINDLSEALLKDQKTAWMWDNRGFAYYKLGMYDEAISDFTALLKVDSGYKRGYRRRGDAYRDTNRYELALQDYSDGLEIAPDNVTLLLRRARLYSEYLSDNKEALKDIEHILKLDPDNNNAMIMKSKLL